jgi:hypothetical protein
LLLVRLRVLFGARFYFHIVSLAGITRGGRQRGASGGRRLPVDLQGAF